MLFAYFLCNDNLFGISLEIKFLKINYKKSGLFSIKNQKFNQIENLIKNEWTGLKLRTCEFFDQKKYLFSDINFK